MTHLYNAMAPATAAAALAHPAVVVQVIVDGHHVDGATVLGACARHPAAWRRRCANCTHSAVLDDRLEVQRVLLGGAGR